MKVALFHDQKYQNDTTQMIVNILENYPEVTMVQELRIEDMEICAEQGEAQFKFGEYLLNTDDIDVLIFRGGHSAVSPSVLLAKYCKDKGVKVFDNNLHRVKYLINKKVDAINFSINNLPIPRSWFYSDVKEIDTIDLKFPIIMKTIHTGQGKNVRMANSIEDIKMHLKDIGQRISKFVFQEFIEYEKDIRLIVLGDEVIGAMQRIPHDGEFRANFSLGGEVMPFDAPSDMKELAVKAARACDLLYGGIDILVDKEGRNYVLEANRTPGMVGISQALGINVVERFVEYVLSSKRGD